MQYPQNPGYAQNPYAQNPQYAQAPAMEYVGVGMRFLALLIDAIILGVAGGIIGFIFGVIFRSAAGSTLASLVIGVLALLYFFWLEATQGATIGKKALGLRVVKEDGSPIGWSESIIRNLLRIVDSLFGYLVGAIFVWTSPRKQRLGDKAAHTVVVKNRS